MSVRPGIVWGTTGTPDDLVAQVSVWQEALDPDVYKAAVEEFLVEAVEELKGYIETRGIFHGMPTGDGRVLTGAMLDSVDYAIKVLGNSRVQAQFGYLKNPPKWALWQEYGTEGGQGNGIGIREMLALTDAYTNFEAKLADAFNNGRVIRFGQGGYAR